MAGFLVSMGYKFLTWKGRWSVTGLLIFADREVWSNVKGNDLLKKTVHHPVQQLKPEPYNHRCNALLTTQPHNSTSNNNDNSWNIMKTSENAGDVSSLT